MLEIRTLGSRPRNLLRASAQKPELRSERLFLAVALKPDRSARGPIGLHDGHAESLASGPQCTSSVLRRSRPSYRDPIPHEPRDIDSSTASAEIGDRGREDFWPRLPPNRTGGFPAYGSTVDGFLIGTV